MKYITAILLPLFIFISLNQHAQSAQRDEDRFFYGSEVDEDLMSIIPEKTFFSEGIQYGAIISPVYLYEGNGTNNLSSSVTNMKIWTKTYLWNNSYLYVSVRDSYLGVLSKKGSIYANTKSDNTFDLDQAFLSMTFSDAALKFSAGRKYFNIGTGLVLNGRGDGAEFTYSASVFSINVLGLYTGLLQKDNNPYGLSVKDLSDGAERAFSGGIISADLSNQHLYIFGLVQTDLSKQEKLKETKYNSQYYGAGIDGVILGNLSYYAETVFESGKSYIENSNGNERSNIAAYAANTGVNYFIPVDFNPTLILQYAYGSGDAYRTNNTNGNRPSDATGYDRGFISFGTFTGGYALKPVLSNIHILRAGVTIVPLAGSDSLTLKKISLGAKYSYYLKDNQNSPINNNEAEGHKSFIGQGVDVSLRWQMFYDASFYVNYGLFLPGDAYKDKTSQNFVMAGMNLSI